MIMKKILLTIALFLALAPSAYACTYSVSPSTVGVGQSKNVTITVNNDSAYGWASLVFPYNSNLQVNSVSSFYTNNTGGTSAVTVSDNGTPLPERQNPTYLISLNVTGISAGATFSDGGGFLYDVGGGSECFLSGNLTVGTNAPTYIMNTSAQGAVTGLLGSMVASVFNVIPLALLIVGGLVVTLFGIRWLIGFARSHMHG